MKDIHGSNIIDDDILKTIKNFNLLSNINKNRIDLCFPKLIRFEEFLLLIEKTKLPMEESLKIFGPIFHFVIKNRIDVNAKLFSDIEEKDSGWTPGWVIKSPLLWYLFISSYGGLKKTIKDTNEIIFNKTLANFYTDKHINSFTGILSHITDISTLFKSIVLLDVGFFIKNISELKKIRNLEQMFIEKSIGVSNSIKNDVSLNTDNNSYSNKQSKVRNYIDEVQTYEWIKKNGIQGYIEKSTNISSMKKVNILKTLGLLNNRNSLNSL